MQWDTPFKCAIGTTAFFKRRCKKCGSMTVNSGLIIPRSAYEENKLVFECFECGHKWKSREIERIDHAFVRYLNDFAKVIVVRYNSKDQIATQLDENRVLLMKPDKCKVVKASEVSVAGGTLPIAMIDQYESLIGLEAIHKAGCKIAVRKCECGSYMVGSKIEKVWWVHCKERLICSNCGKKVEHQRYGARGPEISEREVCFIQSNKTDVCTFGIDMGKFFLIYRKGKLKKVGLHKAHRYP